MSNIKKLNEELSKIGINNIYKSKGLLDNVFKLSYLWNMIFGDNEQPAQNSIIYNFYDNSHPRIINNYCYGCNKSPEGNNTGKKDPVEKALTKQNETNVVVQIKKDYMYKSMARDFYAQAKTISQSNVHQLKNINYLIISTIHSKAVELGNALKKELPFVNDVWKAKDYLVPEVQIITNKKIEIKNLWNLSNVQAYKAHQLSRGQNVTVAVLDTGVDYYHHELNHLFTNGFGYNAINENEPPIDRYGHGTHCAGIIGGQNIGIAPEISMYSVKVLSDEGYGNEATVLMGMDWSIDAGVDVMSMSLGSNQKSKAEQDMVDVAADNGISIVAAAGNEGDYSYGYPASLNHVISVAAVDNYNERAKFSNMNDKLDIAAPGVSILSSYPGGIYEYLSGTSMATPHIAGALAIAKSYYNRIASKAVNKKLEKIMLDTALKLPDEFNPDLIRYGNGLVQIYDMLRGLE